jgi:hypothetical protein
MIGEQLVRREHRLSAWMRGPVDGRSSVLTSSNKHEESIISILTLRAVVKRWP